MLVAQSCPTLCDPMDCSPPGSSVHEIFQARILEWVAISFSRGSSQPRDRTRVSCTAGFKVSWKTCQIGEGTMVTSLFAWFQSLQYIHHGSYRKEWEDISWSIAGLILDANSHFHTLGPLPRICLVTKSLHLVLSSSQFPRLQNYFSLSLNSSL